MKRSYIHRASLSVYVGTTSLKEMRRWIQGRGFFEQLSLRFCRLLKKRRYFEVMFFCLKKALSVSCFAVTKCCYFRCTNTSHKNTPHSPFHLVETGVLTNWSTLDYRMSNGTATENYYEEPIGTVHNSATRPQVCHFILQMGHRLPSRLSSLT
jgi:hypothetical protein